MVMNMTREEYMLKPFRDNEDIIKERTAAGIENARKGFATVRVVDADGKPVPGAKISVRQKTHDFGYGANIFMLDEFETEEKNAEYRRVFREYFNMATVPFYWDTLEPDEGHPRFAKDSKKVYRRPAPDLCLEYCEENGIRPKAHCLNYDHFVPAWLKRYTAREIRHTHKGLGSHERALVAGSADEDVLRPRVHGAFVQNGGACLPAERAHRERGRGTVPRILPSQPRQILYAD